MIPQNYNIHKTGKFCYEMHLHNYQLCLCVEHKEHYSCCFRQLAECELRDMEVKGSVAEQEFVAK